ncbi:MAG: hypothetical protein IK031_01435 [Bacteroidales bacterium]|nr:hypothetical protein [Bacteroidales bacterium]
MKQPYNPPEICTDELLPGLGFLLGSNEGYDVDIVDTGFVNPEYTWL